MKAREKSVYSIGFAFSSLRRLPRFSIQKLQSSTLFLSLCQIFHNTIFILLFIPWKNKNISKNAQLFLSSFQIVSITKQVSLLFIQCYSKTYCLINSATYIIKYLSTMLLHFLMSFYLFEICTQISIVCDLAPSRDKTWM